MLSNQDLIEVGKKYNIHPAVIKAVILVESSGKGFYDKGAYKGELLVRFEGHHFRKYTKGKYDKSHPTLSYSDWKLGYKYNKGISEFGRFLEAFKLDREAAWMSTSWGMFQIMGWWGEKLYGSTKNMILEFYKGEKQQLEGFIKYCIANNILDDLQRLDFAGFCRVYNGVNYKVNRYDEKMEGYYNAYKNDFS